MKNTDFFTFKKNAWHLRMVKFFWGWNHSDFRNMCNYFWLAVFTFIFSPILILIAGIVMSFQWSSKRLKSYDEYMYQKQMEWQKNYLEKLKNDPEEQERFLNLTINGRKCDKKYDKLLDSIWYKAEWLDLITKYSNRKVKIREEVKIKKEEVKLTRTQKIIKINNFIKPFTKWLLYGVGLLSVSTICYWSYVFIKWCISHPFDPVRFMLVLKVVGVAIGLVIGTIIISILISLISRSYENANLPCVNIIPMFKTIFTPFKWLWIGLTILWNILVSFKKDHCPGIKWED